MQQTFQNFDKNTVINLYKSYIWPVLEYGIALSGDPSISLIRESAEKSN